MAAELLPLIAEMLRRAIKEGLEVKLSDEREGVLLEVEQEGLHWLVGEDGTVYCDDCGWVLSDEEGSVSSDECGCEG